MEDTRNQAACRNNQATDSPNQLRVLARVEHGHHKSAENHSHVMVIHSLNPNLHTRNDEIVKRPITARRIQLGFTMPQIVKLKIIARTITRIVLRLNICAVINTSWFKAPCFSEVCPTWFSLEPCSVLLSKLF